MFKQYFFTSFILIFFNSIVFPQNSITVILKSTPKDADFVIHLNEYIDGAFVEIEQKKVKAKDSTEIVKFEIFESNHTKLHEIYLDEGINKVEFLHNPNEPNLEITSWYYGLKNGDIFFNDSPENEAYGQLIQTMKEYSEFLLAFEKEASLLTVFDKDYKQNIIEIEEKIEKLQTLLNINLEKIEIKFPKTFTALSLVRLNKIPTRLNSILLKMKYDSYLSFLHEHFFDYVDFSDIQILNHYALREKIMYYLNSYVDKSTDQIEKSLSIIFERDNLNTQVNSYMYTELMRLFISVGNDHLVEHLTNKYGSGCSLDLTLQELKKLYSIQNTKIGSKAPELLLFDNNHKAKSLMETAKNNKITVVYFWISWCVHCKKTTPELQETYNLFHKKGFEIYAVSLDEEEANWQEALSANKSKWINIAEITPIKNSTVAKTYNLSKTPTLFVLNDKGEIIAKNLFGKDLNDFLKEKLK